MKEKRELHLDFCEECFQMTNHLDDECQKCKAKKIKPVDMMTMISKNIK